jgi:type VI secretion system protein ImpK
VSGGGPFTPDDGEKTVIRPNPGGRFGANPPSNVAARPVPTDASATIVSETGVNSVVAAAAPLLALCVRLRGTPGQPDVEGLWRRVTQALQTFERRALAAGASAEQERAARYALAATVDDVVLNTPWGANSIWAGRSMVSTFFGEVSGGQRFYDILAHLTANAATNLPVLELFYLCLSLGFEGKYRIEARGANRHVQVRDELFRTIRNQRGEFERELSPHWQGAGIGHRPLASAVPLWVAALAAALVLLVAYGVLAIMLNRASDRVFATLGDLPPRGKVVLARAAPPPPPPPMVAQLPRIKRFLEPEIREGLVTVFEDAQSVTVRLRGEGMFDSGKADLRDGYAPILDRVAAALNDVPGKILVTGHTDNVPIHTLRFPSNWHLSLARAEAVKARLADKLSDPGRVSAEGRADSEPIAPNTTPAGREQNRRIEVVLLKQAPGAVAAPTGPAPNTP